jgi:hypothetical protein
MVCLLLVQHKAAAEAEAARAAAEAEENQRRLKEEEARAAEEQQRARMQQCDKEVDEIKVRAACVVTGTHQGHSRGPSPPFGRPQGIGCSFWRARELHGSYGSSRLALALAVCILIQPQAIVHAAKLSIGLGSVVQHSSNEHS